MSRIIIIIPLCLFSLIICASHSWSEEKIKIGFPTSLTGQGAVYGQDEKNTAIFANEKLANNKYEIIFEDDKCEGREAVTVAHRFVSVLKVKFILGLSCSSSVLSPAPIYEKAQIPVISVFGSSPAITHAGDFIFRTAASDAAAAKKLYQYIAPRHTKLGVVSEEADFSQDFLTEIKKANTKGSLQIINENFLSHGGDLRTLLLKLKGAGIDSLFINSQTEKNLLEGVLRAGEIRLDVPIYGAYNPGGQTFLRGAGPAAEGVTFVDYPFLDEALNPEGKKLFAEFKERFGPPQGLELAFLTTFEGFRAMHEALSSGQDVRKYLYSAKFSGLTGEWWFDENGDIAGIEHVMKKIVGGKAVAVSGS